MKHSLHVTMFAYNAQNIVQFGSFQSHGNLTIRCPSEMPVRDDLQKAIQLFYITV